MSEDVTSVDLDSCLPGHVVEALEAYRLGELVPDEPEFEVERLEDYLHGVMSSACHGPPDSDYTEGPWLVALSDGFMKAVDRLDRKLAGRVLEAIMKIAKSPVTPRGSTVKRLSGPHKALWRYRLGNYRLIYEPKTDARHIIMLDVAARGGVYGRL